MKKYLVTLWKGNDEYCDAVRVVSDEARDYCTYDVVVEAETDWQARNKAIDTAVYHWVKDRPIIYLIKEL